MSIQRPDKRALFFILLGAVFFIPFLGGVHLFDWDEINFAEIAREMILLDDYLHIHINFVPFMEKPPLFFWLQALSMHLFGIGEFAARFPNAIAGVVTLPVLYLIGRRLFDRQFGLFWALTYFGSILTHLYFRSGIIDPFFNFFTFLGIYFLILFYWKKQQIPGIRIKEKGIILLVFAGLFTGLAVLTKGPVAILVTALTGGVYWVLNRFRPLISIPNILAYAVVVLGVTGVWLGVETLQNGPAFAIEFTIRQYELFSQPDAGHGGFPGYHFVVLLIGCFPASIFAIQAMLRRPDSADHRADFKKWMTILFWVVLILFTIVKSKIVHYSSLAYFPLTFLATWSIVNIIREKERFRSGLRILFIVLAVLIALPLLVLPFIMKDPMVLAALLEKDPFALANLQAEVHWSGWEVLPGIILLVSTGGFLFLLGKRKAEVAFKALLLGGGLFVWSALIFYIARVEKFSQHAAVAFCEERIGEDCYVHPYGYKSYVHLFYTRKPIPDNPNHTDQEWLLTGDIDKPVYIITKVHKAKRFEEEYPQFKKVGDKNGFWFYLRKPEGRN